MNKEEQDEKAQAQELTPNPAPPLESPTTELSEEDLKSISGGAMGVKKTMQTQV